MIWIETPTNPLLRLVDIAAVGRDRARAQASCCVVDNTFATPWIQRPLELGADIVMHSATKFLNGHSDMVGGVAIVVSDAELGERVGFLHKCDRRDLPGRSTVSRAARPEDAAAPDAPVERVGARDRIHARAPPARRARRLSVPAFAPAARARDAPDAKRRQRHRELLPRTAACRRRAHFLERLRASSRSRRASGGVESLVDHPAIMTHASVPPEARAKLGINDSLIRLSVGIEDVEDLIADLEQALG